MLQELSDECKDTWFYSEIEKCPVSQTVVENTITVDYNACDASFREACTADNGKLEAGNYYHYLLLLPA